MQHAQVELGDAPELDRLRSLVSSCFEAIAADQERELQPLTDALRLSESGLDSLCFALIVAQLEDELGVDPFSEADDSAYPVTYGDFVRAYQATVRRPG